MKQSGCDNIYRVVDKKCNFTGACSPRRGVTDDLVLSTVETSLFGLSLAGPRAFFQLVSSCNNILKPLSSNCGNVSCTSRAKN